MKEHKYETAIQHKLPIKKENSGEEHMSSKRRLVPMNLKRMTLCADIMQSQMFVNKQVKFNLFLNLGFVHSAVISDIYRPRALFIFLFRIM